MASPSHPEQTSTGAGAAIPALRFSWLTRFFDPLMGVFIDERELRGQFIAQADIQPGHRVLDLGCGTGTLVVMIKSLHPAAVVTGLDADPRILAIAREKLISHEAVATLVIGSAICPPFEPETFDRVVSSLVFHHLRTDEKQQALREIMRVLKPGGRLFVLDWGPAANALQRTLFLMVRVLDGFAVTADSVHGRLPELMEEAGFREVAEVGARKTLMGTLSTYRGTKATV